MPRGIRLLPMPDLSTKTRAKSRVSGIFRLAPGVLHVSFQSSDDKMSNRRDIKGGCKTSRKRTEWADSEIDRWVDHGTRQFPRVEVKPVSQLESSPSPEKDDGFGRCPDRMTKGFPGEAGPRKGPGQTAAGSFRRTPRRSVLRAADRQKSGPG